MNRPLSRSLSTPARLLFMISVTALPAVLPAQPPSPYLWKNVTIRGGGFVSGIVFSKAQKNLVYARTDVGGAYRSDDAGENWIPLTDSFGRRDSSYLGIESLALDPQDANKVYLAAGMYSEDWGGPAAILRSSDKGRTWLRTPMPFKMGGNDDGRNCGEKLAVDPNLGSILFFGSRKAGLWKSADSGATWAHVDSFPIQDKVAGPWEKVGITLVLFDKTTSKPGQATPSIYVGVAQAGASFYRSDDAGATWTVVADAPNGLFPSHALQAPDGQIYVSFINDLGPNGITNGAILRYSAGNRKWKDISPVKPGSGDQKPFGFGGLAVDQQHPNTLMVTTLDRWWPTDAIFRTTDAGKHWKETTADAVFSAPGVPWVYWHHEKTGGTGWMTDIAIDPFNPAKVMYTTGEGIWGSADVTASDQGKPSHWGFPNDGLEETVPIALISPPQGAHLLSGVGDINGFRHDSLINSPTEGFFDEPVFTNTDSLDFAAAKPLLIVRVGRGQKKIVHGAYSNDGGTKWKPFAGEPSDASYGGGYVAISADGAAIVWTLPKGKAYRTGNLGQSWTECAGLPDTMPVVADRVNPNKFYAFDHKTGKFYISVDEARTFAALASPIASPGDYGSLTAAPGLEGDLWAAAGGHLYHSTDSGLTFAALQGVSRVYSLGFGKAAPGSTYPAIYLAGEVGPSDSKLDGIYRSNDSGQNWLRINDDEHQYGWVGLVAGDPRIYGRVYLGTGGRGIIVGDVKDPPSH